MNRYRSTFPLDEAEIPDGDAEFLGVNSRVDPHMLPPGMISDGYNLRFIRRRAKPRLGLQKLPWSNQTNFLEFTADASTDKLTTKTEHYFRTADPVGVQNFPTGDPATGELPGGLSATAWYYARVLNAVQLTLHTTAAAATAGTGAVNITSAGTAIHKIFPLRPWPFAKIHGVGVFSDPDDVEWVIVAADDTAYRTREGSLASELPLPTGVTIAASVFFAQAVNDFLMFRGTSLTPLKMSDVDTGFESVAVSTNTVRGASTENPVDGTQVIPNADLALFAGNRLYIPHSRDLVAVSDYLNYTRYQPTRSVFRINQGTSDKLVALFKFNDQTIICAKEESIYMVGGLIGGLGNAFADEITRAYGVRAAKSFAQVGRDVWFLADRRGVVSIQQTEQNKLHAVDLPVSDPIQPYIDRVNWTYADKARAAYIDNKYYLAVPIDSARVEKSSLLDGTETYDSIGRYRVNVRKGRKYRFKPGANDSQLVNGTETVTTESDFTAQGNEVMIWASGVMLIDDFEEENGGKAAANYTGWKNWELPAPGDRVDLLAQDNHLVWDHTGGTVTPMPEQRRYIDTIGTYAAAGMGPVEFRSKTSFSFAAGTQYKFKFKAGGSQRGNTATLGVTIGTLVSDSIALDSGAAFAERVYTFTPAAPESAKILFSTTSNINSNAGALVDDIGLSAGDKTGLAVTAQILPVFDGVNNAVLVYDFLNQAWTPPDQGTTAYPLMVQEWFTHTYNGVRRLFCATEDGFINLYEEAFEDEMANSHDQVVVVPVESKLVTRGYRAGTDDFKRFRRAQVVLSTWNPAYSITARFDGALETKALKSGVTRSRARYFKPFDKAAYAVTNADDDHATAYREDYSVDLSAEATTVDPLANGIDPEILQTYPDRSSIGRDAQFVQIEIINTTGRAEIPSVTVTAASGPRRSGTHT